MLSCNPYKSHYLLNVANTAAFIAALLFTSFALADPPGKDAESETPQEMDRGPVPLETPPVVYQSVTSVRFNPIGLVSDLDVQYRIPLYTGLTPVTETNYFSMGIIPGVSPAFGRLGGAVHLQPMSILRLSARIDWIEYFGAFGHLQTFPEITSDYSDNRLEQRDNADENIPANGYQFTFSGLFQLKFGPFAARTNISTFFSEFDLPQSDDHFYDAIYDILIPNRSWALNINTDLLFFAPRGWLLGVRHTHTRLLDSSDEAQNLTIDRIGPLLALTVIDREGPYRIEKITLFALANWHLNHIYRAGQEQSQGMPYLAMGLSVSGHLLSSPYGRSRHRHRVRWNHRHH